MTKQNESMCEQLLKMGKMPMSDKPVGAESHQFRKKPVVIQAIRWEGDNTDELDEFAPEAKIKAEGHRNALVIETLEGTMLAEPGDWIIRGIANELYPCKPDIFAATYEKVGAESGAQPDLLETLKEIEQFISDLASSAMLAGEEYPAEDRSTFYSEACKAKNSIAWIMDELAKVAKHAPLSQAEICPSCQALDNNPYTDAKGKQMRACGRCMIQWSVGEVEHAPQSQENIWEKCAQIADKYNRDREKLGYGSSHAREIAALIRAESQHKDEKSEPSKEKL